MTERSPLPVVLDCDTGVDDAMAIFFGLLAPEIEVAAIGCVWGNVRVETATQNSLRLLEIVDRPRVPVAPGAAKPLLGAAFDWGLTSTAKTARATPTCRRRACKRAASRPLSRSSGWPTSGRAT